MNKFLIPNIMTLGLLIGTIPLAHSADALVEIRLIDDIDESRGYCLDVAGGQGTEAPVEKGLQAHTCYDYTGGLLEDQSFAAALVEEGQFKISYFDVCMTASEPVSGSALMLAECENTDTQMFSLGEDGNLTLQTNPELCVTANSTEKKEGRGGTPVHVMRPLSLQPCSDDDKAYQAWSVFSL